MGIQKVSYYTGSDLKTYINNFTSGIYEKRDFVNSISEYLQSPIANRRIMGISGLRGTGKTVGILQVIKDLNNYVGIGLGHSSSVPSS